VCIKYTMELYHKDMNQFIQRFTIFSFPQLHDTVQSTIILFTFFLTCLFENLLYGKHTMILFP